MNYLDKLKRLQPEQRTDKTDMLPESVSLSGMSGPCPTSPGENAPPTADPVAVGPAPLDVTIQPASSTARPIYWERADGRIYGPAVPEFLAQVGVGLNTTDFWIVARFEGRPIWINSMVLRSKQAFEQQVAPKIFERIKEPR